MPDSHNNNRVEIDYLYGNNSVIIYMQKHFFFLKLAETTKQVGRNDQIIHIGSWCALVNKVFPDWLIVLYGIDRTHC